jgi:hypothetical protein
MIVGLFQCLSFSTCAHAVADFGNRRLCGVLGSYDCKQRTNDQPYSYKLMKYSVYVMVLLETEVLWMKSELGINAREVI